MVKICGLTRAEDVAAARDLGAWALGFVFAPSPRRLTPDVARELLERVAATSRTSADSPARWVDSLTAAPLAVGVFGDVPAGEVAWIVEQVGLDAVQLHGAAGPSAGSVRLALAGWERPLRLAGGRRSSHPLAGGSEPGPTLTSPLSDAGPRGVLIIQAVPVDPREEDRHALWERVQQARADADLLLLDTREAGRLGGTGTPFPWGLAQEVAAGCPLLVAGGVAPGNVRAALERSSARGVDVSSGVEVSPGVKDARLMERLFAEVAEAGHACGSPEDRAEAQGDDEHEPQKGPRK